MKLSEWLAQGKFRDLLLTACSRRQFLKLLAAGLAALAISGRSARKALAKTGVTLAPRPGRKIMTDCPLAAVTGRDPERITRAAVDALGGIRRFVAPGAVVVVKPNIGWDRTPEQAANTHPAVVGALVAMCREAGAKVVKVFDNTCNDARRTYASSGIADAARKAGGLVFYVSDWKFVPARFPAGSLMQDWPIYRDAVECDCFINVPVAKHHGLSGLTLSMKNLMGVCGGLRGRMHWDLDRKLVELTDFIRPDLTVIDAYRILLRNGPTGGDLEDVRLAQTVLASPDPVLADAYAATLFQMAPEAVGYVRLGAQRGLGSLDVKQAGIRRLRL